MSVLRVRGLSVEVDGRFVVAGVDLEIAAGECLAIVGESGSGKSMTANALLGLSPRGARVGAEELTVGGVDTRGFTERDWRGLRGVRAGLVSQDALVSLDPLRRVGREVAEPIEVHEPGASAAEVGGRVIRMLERVSMPRPQSRARQYPHELSGGLRQRALIASALAAEPVLLIADEPTTALDVTVQTRILDLLEELNASGLALLLISHDLAVVARLADRIAVMKDGVIVETAATRELIEHPQHPYTRQLLAAQPRPRETTAAIEGPTVLEARGLAKSYRMPGGEPLLAVDGVSLRLVAGSTVGIVGESGSGKSTLARLLMATEPPDRGQVLLGGAPWSTLRERERRGSRGRIQLIDQDPFGAFDPRWEVRRILAEAIALGDTPRAARRQRAAELLAQVGLDESLLGRRAVELSGGQRQRVAIARALARDPEILVCDEPVSALDVSVQAQVLDLLVSLQREFGLAMVFISHDLGVIAHVSDEILVMSEGAVVESGPTARVLREPRHPFTRQLLASVVVLGKLEQ
jgi:peptide/nickel transport system ATP-binding protein